MPILYNFHIFLATFYMIYLDELPSASSCLLHVFCFAENPYQTESKWNKNRRRFICDFWEEESTRNDARGPGDRGRAPGRQAHPGLSCPPTVRRFTLLFCRRKANFMGKIWAKDSPQSELRISGYKRNGEGAESENAETER